jgi:hypothetical protein
MERNAKADQPSLTWRAQRLINAREWTMAHWIEATAEHNRRRVRINADAIAYIVQEHIDGPTHVHFVGSDFASGKPDLLVIEKPDVLIARIERPR